METIELAGSAVLEVLTGSIRRLAKLAARLPPKAKPR